MSSAYILYPGEVLVHDEDYPEVGALPVVPGEVLSGQVQRVLVDLLENGGVLAGGGK